MSRNQRLSWDKTDAAIERIRANNFAHIMQLCDAAAEKHEIGEAKFKEGDFREAADAYEYSTHYYNQALFFRNVRLKSHYNPLALERVNNLLDELKALLEPVYSHKYDSFKKSLNSEFGNDAIYSKSERELRRVAQHTIYNERKQAESQLNQIKTEIEDEELAPVFNTNIIAGSNRTVSYNRESVSTNFTDEQAAVVCSKMSAPYARHIAAKFLQLRNQIQGAVYRYQVHYLANKALAFYGGPVLTFLLGLRPLKFNDLSAHAVHFRKPSADISLTDADFPALTFSTLKGDKYTLAFHLAGESLAQAAKRPVKIFNRGTHVGSIDANGFILDPQGALIKKLQETKSSLLTFCGFLANSKNPAFYSGVETGNCFICNRRLTDPVSIRYGIGPVCLGRAIS